MQFYSGYHPMVDYFNAMDSRAYEGEEMAKEGVGLGIRDIGMSVPLGISAANVAGIYAKIRSGVGNIELGFPGAVRGQRQAQTPEMYGEDQRQAIRELGAINEVQFTTHASYGIMGLAGFTGDNPYNVWFQREQRKIAVDEIKRAIEFARDTAGGGSVVVHTGEVERSISEQPWAQDPNAPGGYRFKQFEEEPQSARIRVVDDRTGHVVQQIWKGQKIGIAKWKRAGHDYEGEYQDGIPETDYNKNQLGKKITIRKGDYIDYEGRKIIDPLDVEHGRVPEYNEKTGRFEVNEVGWDYFVKDAKEINRLEDERRKALGKPEFTEWERQTPDERYLRASMETNEGYSRGWALQFSIGVKENVKNIEKYKKALKFYEKMEASVSPEDKWKIMKREPARSSLMQIGLVPEENKLPTDIIKKAIWEEERNLAYHQQSGQAQEKQARDSRESQEHLKNADKYAIREAVKSYAEAGIHAMECTINQDKPVMITMENIFPERYGGHPEELKNLIRKSREEMVNRLSHRYIEDPAGIKDSDTGLIKKIPNPYFRGISEEEAIKKAETHIKATLDTGHINIWRKYWQDDHTKSLKENDEDFKKWIVVQVEDLAKNKMIGNVHLTDNFGYQDDHLAPGQGTTPVKEIVKVLKKHGYDKAWTVEPGADASTDVSDFHGLMKAWRHFGSPVYGIGMRAGAPQTWTDVQYSYFGQNKPPYYIFGAYAPSNDWTLWSATPME